MEPVFIYIYEVPNYQQDVNAKLYYMPTSISYNLYAIFFQC